MKNNNRHSNKFYYNMIVVNSVGIITNQKVEQKLFEV